MEDAQQPASPQQPASAQQPSVPPQPAHAPHEAAAGGEFLAWLRASRPDAPAGLWRLGYQPRPEVEPEQVPGRQLVGGALLAALVGWLAWSIMWNGYLGGWWLIPLELLTPDSWRFSDSKTTTFLVYYGYYALIAGGLLTAVFRIGRWGQVWSRYAAPRLKPRTPALPPPPPPAEDPAHWPGLRAAGAPEAADRLAADARTGRMRDVDVARINRAWQTVRAGHLQLPAFTTTVLKNGAAACAHPSGARDLPARTATHDLLTGQVRLGAVADDARNPYAYRQQTAALDYGVLSAGLLAVGPAGSGKTSRIMRPAAEALCLGALTGTAAVVTVGPGSSPLGPADGYDVVIRLGDPASQHDLDLYAGTRDPDEAATVLAEALVGDLTEQHSAAGRAATVLAQLLGPFQAVHSRFPSVPELRQLLDGAGLDDLRAELTAAGHASMLRDLEARQRQASTPGDAAGLLADRLALLDRPAFADFFSTDPAQQPFSLRALDHPVRVRIDLPARGHADASRILARLVLAQFLTTAAAREDRSLFACLLLDDAAGTLTPQAVRGLQHLRTANAGAALALRTLDDVPRPLRSPLLGAVGSRIALSGITSWDGQDFADAWGKEWTEARDVTDRQIVADEPMTKVSHALRKAITGKAPTAQAVTVRQVERERWSASDLAHRVPAGHAVLSLTTTRGEHSPPLLVNLLQG